VSTHLSEADQKKWRKVLVEGHPALTIVRRIFRYLPSPPRCKVCHDPFGGIGGRLVGLMGFLIVKDYFGTCPGADGATRGM
jgi:hypothetical protein